MSGVVDDVWHHIVGWLTAYAPGTAAQVRGPAAPEAIDAVEQDVGVTLPADLRAWWQLTDGFPPGVLDPLIPWIHVPLSVENAREQRRRLADPWAHMEPDSDVHDLEAGTFTGRFQLTLVPISEDHCGQVNFVDLRAGRLHGCIGEWDHEEGFLRPPTWMSVTDMLTDVANALDSGGPAMVEFAERLWPAGSASDPRAWAHVDGNGELEWNDQPVARLKA
jgi:cell wall assembly regulator SMI1